MSDLQQRIVGIYLRESLREDINGDVDWPAHIAEALVSELGLRELPATGYLDPRGFLHMSIPEGKSPDRYVQYISGWLPA